MRTMKTAFRKNLSVLFTVMLAVMMLAGCGSKKYEAVPINESVDVCAVCKMQVKDDAFATQLTTKDGKTYKFDDLGCMNTWKQQNGTDHIGMDFVRDYNDKEWIEFGKAYYVYDEALRTPMAYGIVSFKDQKSAEAFIAEQGVGKLMNAQELEAHTWQRNNMGNDMHEGHGDHEHDEETEGHMDQDMQHESDTSESSHTESQHG